jgi:seryl-tRNA synthetase
MLDIRLIRSSPEKVEELLRRKEPDLKLAPVLELDEKLRHAKTEMERLQARQNAASKEIGAKKRAGEDVAGVMAEMGSLAEQVHKLEHQVRELEQQFNEAISVLPNLPREDVPISQEPKENVQLSAWGEQRDFGFAPKNHVELNEKLNLFDFARAAKVSGQRWVAYRGLGAQLEWALLQMMMDRQRKRGFMQWIPPICVQRQVVYASGQLPKFEKQQFRITDEDYDLFLIPTAEVVLNGLHMDEIVPEEQLPLRYMAYTPCFRREAGAAGSHERGLIRVHQFNKLELFGFATPDQSDALFDHFVRSAQLILEELEMHHRTMLLVTGDTSWASQRTFDIEVYLPGQNRYYEVSSVSHCSDFQARRSSTRYRPHGGKPEFLHTINGSGLATSRLMVALLENNQQPDGSVTIPRALRPYMDGLEVLTPAS